MEFLITLLFLITVIFGDLGLQQHPLRLIFGLDVYLGLILYSRSVSVLPRLQPLCVALPWKVIHNCPE